MRIEKLTVYGFGKHENLTINIDEAVAVFFGRNEAGKTTLQQFIIQILFGFPSRHHTGNRYEPKGGGKYGGQLHIDDAQFGKLVIERVKGKAAGDVTVFFEDGTRGAEAELKKILRNYDRFSFESIFSFSIHELQGLDKMNEAQLSRTLLASGTTGVDAITKLETELEKEMDELFKKGGRKPELNALIEELKNDEKELKLHREQADSYGPSLEQLKLADKEIKQLTERENQLTGMLAEAGKQQQAAPLVAKKKSLEQQLSILEVSSFPVDGSRRMEGITDRLSEAAATKKQLEDELAVLPEPKFSEDSSTGLAPLLERESDWHRFSADFIKLKDEKVKLQEELDRQLGLIGMPLDKALQFDVSLINEEKLVNLARKADQEEENSRFRERQLQDEKKKLIDAEKEMSVLENTAPTEEEQKTAKEWPALSARLAEAKALQRMGGRKENRFVSYLLIALGVAGLLIGITLGEALISLLAAGAVAAGAFVFWQSRSKKETSEDTGAFIERFSGREAEMESLQRKIIDHDRKVEETLKIIDSCDQRIAELEREIQNQPAKQEFENYLEHLGITAASGSSIVLELFKTIRKVQEIAGKLKRTEVSLTRAAEEQAVWLEDAAAATGFSVHPENMYTVLRNEARKLQEFSESERRNAEKRETLAADLQRQDSLLARLEIEKQQLLDESGSADIEAFHQNHLDWVRKKEIEKELELVWSQLQTIGTDGDISDEDSFSISARISELENELSQLKNRRNGLVEEKAGLQQRVNHLLTDEAYEIKLQYFEEKKARFNELAHRWSVNKAIAEAIRNTMDELKEKSLPAVLGKACVFFQRLTGGAYTAMEIHPDGHFEAIRRDHMRFRIAELSQATKEQAYLSLRLSLAVSMQKSHPFPIIMDDPFVHFDRLRLQQVIDLIKELQTDHQFIYFTCHEEMCDAWPEAQVIDVANTGRSVYL